MKVVVVQPYVPRYRSAFYRRATEELARHDIQLQVAVGRVASSRGDADGDFDAFHSPDLLEPRSHGRLRYRRLGPLLSGTDLLLLEQAVKNLDGYEALLRHAAGGPSVGFWGHGRTYSAQSSRAVSVAKDWMTRRADWFFAYTQGGADHVISRGFPATRITVLNNTLDTDNLQRDLDTITEEEIQQFARQHETDPDRSVLFIGGLDAKKDTAYLEEFAAASARIDPSVTILVAGAGPDSARLQAAAEAGLPLRMLGRVDGHSKALALRACRLLALPSQLGLVVIDSLVAGTPIVSRRDRLHGPEAEYLRDGVDCVLLDSDVDAADFARTMVDLLDDPQRYSRMSAACLESARAHRLDDMVEAFVAGVLAWAEVARYGL